MFWLDAFLIGFRDWISLGGEGGRSSPANYEGPAPQTPRGSLPEPVPDQVLDVAPELVPDLV